MAIASTQLEKERDTLLARLRQSRDAYLRTIKGISDEAAKKDPGNGRWSILQVAEHVVHAERQMLTLWLRLAEPGESERAKDEAIALGSIDRSKKQVAPDRSLPTGKISTMAQAAEQFDFHRGQTIGYVEGTEDNLRGKVVQHPLAGTLDGYQLFLLMAGHVERHAAQIEALKQRG